MPFVFFKVSLMSHHEIEVHSKQDTAAYLFFYFDANHYELCRI